jgi:hypothetical protein
MQHLATLIAITCTGALLAPASLAVTIDWVPVGDAGNDSDSAMNCYAAGCGSVSYSYSISSTEVTFAQYVEFLNAKAATDPLELYDTQSVFAVTRTGTPGSYAYEVKPGFAEKPVNFVTFFDALRFANWLHNGQGEGDTENGSYTLLGGTATPSNAATVARVPSATIAVASENEWYKAAYYDPEAGYFDYPAGSDAQPTCSAPTATPNSANCGFVTSLTDVGAYTGSPSPYGTFDQGGNVAEWIDGGEPIPGARVVRGGSYTELATTLAAASPGATFAANDYPTVGFRLVFVPEPERSLGLLFAAGALRLLARRRAVADRAQSSTPGVL